MPKATAAETAERIERLQGMILSGEPNTACLAYARHTWGVYRAQGYKLVKRAWAQIKDDINKSGIDRQELLSWSIQTLMGRGDGRSWAGDAAEEPGRCGVLHPPARPHDRYRIQLTPRPTTALSRMMALGADQQGFRGH